MAHEPLGTDILRVRSGRLVELLIPLERHERHLFIQEVNSFIDGFDTFMGLEIATLPTHESVAFELVTHGLEMSDEVTGVSAGLVLGLENASVQF